MHLPWCVRKCPYCDFNSYEMRGEIPERAYVDALLRDLDSEMPFVQDRPLESVFIGGGTPSLFSGASVERLLDGMRDRVATRADLEVTLEANPGAVEARRFADYLRAGVNRISIGLQSLRDERLAAIGRVHNAAEAKSAVAAAHDAGFANVNVDLMYGLPGDDTDGSIADLAQALALGPTHLSWYQLTLEPQTAFERAPPPLPDDDTIDQIEQAGRRVLAEHGFDRYEISAYARPDYRCRHNLNYWQFGDYLGIGAGAHGKITIGVNAIERRSRLRNPRSYVAAAGTAAAVTLERIEEPEALRTEFLMNALRLVDGVDFALIEQRTGQSRTTLTRPIEEARKRGWLAAEDTRLRATPAGLQSLNRLLALF